MANITFVFLIAPYRSFTGGIHLKTHLGCMLTTSCLYLGPIIVTKYFQINNDLILYVFTAIITIFSIFIIAKYAPADTENIPILTKKKEKQKNKILYFVSSFTYYHNICT